MKSTLAILTLITFTLLTSCNTLTLEDPTLQRIEDVNINEMTKDRLDMDAHLVINNPNNVALDLASADLEVLVDNVVIANIRQTVDAKMPAKSDFKMPVKLTMDLAQLYKKNPLAALTKGLQIMSEKKLEIQIKGNIKAGKGAIKLTVNVDQLETVKL